MLCPGPAKGRSLLAALLGLLPVLAVQQPEHREGGDLLSILLAVEAAVAALKDSKPDTESLDETIAEGRIADGHKTVAIVRELAEMVARQERAIDHLTDHVVADLERRVRELEGSPAGAKPKN